MLYIFLVKLKFSLPLIGSLLGDFELVLNIITEVYGC